MVMTDLLQPHNLLYFLLKLQEKLLEVVPDLLQTALSMCPSLSAKYPANLVVRGIKMATSCNFSPPF